MKHKQRNVNHAKRNMCVWCVHGVYILCTVCVCTEEFLASSSLGAWCCVYPHRLDFCQRIPASSSPLIPRSGFLRHNNWKLLCAVNYPVRLRKAPIIRANSQEKGSLFSLKKGSVGHLWILHSAETNLFRCVLMTTDLKLISEQHFWWTSSETFQNSTNSSQRIFIVICLFYFQQ